MIKVIFCLPDQQFSLFFLSRITNLLFDLPTFNVKGEVRLPTSHNPYNAHNSCLKSLKKGYDYIMWIDSDSIFEPQQFKKLLDRMEKDKKVNILAGKSLKGNPFAFTLVRNGVFEKIASPWFVSHGVEQFSAEYTFCDKAKRAGFKIDFDPEVKIDFESTTILK